MRTLNLSGSDWTITGYWQNQWRFEKEGNLGQSRRAPVPAVAATVPGSVHTDLLRAGIIPDYQDGLNAERTEWVNNREWMYRRTVTVPAEWEDAQAGETREAPATGDTTADEASATRGETAVGGASASGGGATGVGVSASGAGVAAGEATMSGGYEPRRWLEDESGSLGNENNSRRPIVLECDGLDYSGIVFVDGREVGTFQGTHLRHRFDLSGLVEPGQTFVLEILFHLSPQIEGVFGFTSQTRVFKPRFGYCWDWCPRVVSVGIWQDVRLVQRGPVRLEHARVRTRVEDDLQAGRVRVQGEVVGEPGRMRYEVLDAAGEQVASGEQAIAAGGLDLSIPIERVELWWPNGMSGAGGESVDERGPGRGSTGRKPVPRDQPYGRERANTYTVRLEALDASGRVSDVVERRVGFRQARWLDNPEAPGGAKPYLCEVNGVATFIRGINWVPLSPFYGTVSRQRYEAVLRLYANMNVNMIRVWGGAILETADFYELCDELGLMVWQEFPLSSSGIESWPPEDPAVIEHLLTIAVEYVERRGHHASHVLWCGGNELQGNPQGGKTGVGKPVDELHPLMVRWQELLAAIDPGKRFQASSPSGPTFYAFPENFGKGVHHQTHGPWGWGHVSFDKWHDYWNRDDSLFRSENGVPGCSSVEALERHKGDASLWPPSYANRHWVVPTAAWIPWEDVVKTFGEIADEPASLPTVVKAHRYMQAESYRYAAETCRRRWPTCSGYIIWMGHDNLHNTSNNSVIQTEGATKPAYDVLQRAFGRRHVSLRFDSVSWAPGSRFAGRVFVHDEATMERGEGRGLKRPDADAEPARVEACGSLGPAGDALAAVGGSLTARMLDVCGNEICASEFAAGAADDMLLDWAVPELAERLFIVDLGWQRDGASVGGRYLFSQDAERPLAPLLRLPAAQLQVRREAESRVAVRNTGSVAAVHVRLVCEAPNWTILTPVNTLTLLPGESQVFEYAMVPLEAGLSDFPQLMVECLNQASPIVIE